MHKADLVFEGGGVKGIAFVGALEVFEAHEYEWQNLAGASAGAIIAALVAVGYKASEILGIMENEIDYERFKDKSAIGAAPYIGPYLNLIINKGLYEGDYFLDQMRRILARKMGKTSGEVTFGDLALDEQADDDDIYKYKLQVVVSDLSIGEMIVLPKDSKKRLGVDPRQLEVALAVRMSGGIPFFFEPVRFGKPKKHMLVDGGMLSNFPVWLFDSPEGETPPWPTFGLLLWEPDTWDPESETKPYTPIRNVWSMAKAAASTMMNAHDRKAVEALTNTRILKIPTGKYKTTDFGLLQEDRKWLCDSGRKAAEEFLETWDFEQHKRDRHTLAARQLART